jgi:hypothetical protein
MTDMTPRTRDVAPTRVDKINSQVDDEIHKILKDLDIVASDLDSLMEILKDRMVQSNEASYPIALARLGELRMDTIKKKIDIVKTLVNDKGIEVSSKKKAPVTDLESILSGAALGAALGARVGNNLSMNSNTRQYEDAETVDVGNEEFIVETEHIGDPGKSVSDLLKGE